MSAFPSTPRPRTVTITLWGVFLLGAWNAGRAILLGLQQDLWLQLEIEPDPRLRMVVSLIWAILLWTVNLMLRRRRPRARLFLPFLLLIYAFYELGLLFFFAQAPNAQQRWLIDVVFYGVLILFSYWSLHRPAASAYFDGRGGG